MKRLLALCYAIIFGQALMLTALAIEQYIWQSTGNALLALLIFFDVLFLFAILMWLADRQFERLKARVERLEAAQRKSDQ